MSIFKDDPAKFSVSDSDFDNQLTVGGAGVSEKINMYDCATPEAANRLQDHLVAIGLTQFVPALDWPMGKFVAGSALAQSAKVPYVNFPRVATPDDGATNLHVNVAHILVQYTRYPLKFADALMVQKYGPAQ
jgi:hypothetical protein